MIPKVIHYCWFGKNALPEYVIKTIESWKKHCPDFEIIEWNENNFDVNVNAYCYEAYKTKRWAFVSDYARLKIIYDHGGVYLDTDVELIKNITPLISDNIGYIGFQNSEEIATGLGFAAPSKNLCVGRMLEMYSRVNFIKSNGEYNFLPCPAMNTVALKLLGLKTGEMSFMSIQHLEGMNVYPIDYFNPMSPDTFQLKITHNTYSIHWYAASWFSEIEKAKRTIKKHMSHLLYKYINMRTLRIARKRIADIEKQIMVNEHNV